MLVSFRTDHLWCRLRSKRWSRCVANEIIPDFSQGGYPRTVTHAAATPSRLAQVLVVASVSCCAASACGGSTSDSRKDSNSGGAGAIGGQSGSADAGIVHIAAGGSAGTVSSAGGAGGHTTQPGDAGLAGATGDAGPPGDAGQSVDANTCGPGSGLVQLECCAGEPCRGKCHQGRCDCFGIDGGCWEGTHCCARTGSCIGKPENC